MSETAPRPVTRGSVLRAAPRPVTRGGVLRVAPRLAVANGIRFRSMSASRALLVAVALLALGAGSAPLVAHSPAGGEAASAYAGISMDQAVKMVEQRFRARVVRAEAQQEGARTVYVLRLLDDSGRVWTVRVDAASGAIL